MSISRWILLRMRQVSDKLCREIKTHIPFSITFSLKSCLLWHNVEKYSKTKDDNVIRRMCFACWLNKATDTRSKYVIFIVFQRQQWLAFILTLPALLEFYVCIIFLNSFRLLCRMPYRKLLKRESVYLQSTDNIKALFRRTERLRSSQITIT